MLKDQVLDVCWQSVLENTAQVWGMSTPPMRVSAECPALLNVTFAPGPPAWALPFLTLPACPPIYLSIHPPTHPPIHPIIHSPTYIHESTYLPSLPIYQLTYPTYLATYPPVYIYILYMYTYQLHLSTHLLTYRLAITRLPACLLHRFLPATSCCSP